MLKLMEILCRHNIIIGGPMQFANSASTMRICESCSKRVKRASLTTASIESPIPTASIESSTSASSSFSPSSFTPTPVPSLSASASSNTSYPSAQSRIDSILVEYGGDTGYCYIHPDEYPECRLAPDSPLMVACIGSFERFTTAFKTSLGTPVTFMKAVQTEDDFRPKPGKKPANKKSAKFESDQEVGSGDKRRGHHQWLDKLLIGFRRTRMMNAQPMSFVRFLITSRDEMSRLRFHKSIVTYLTDVDVPAEIQSSLLLHHPVLRRYGPFGMYCMYQYLPHCYRTTRNPDTGRRRFPGSGLVAMISPPTHHRISTSPHIDGYSCFVTTHFIPPCSNPNTMSRVHMWTRVQAGLSADVHELTVFSQVWKDAMEIDAQGASNCRPGARDHSMTDIRASPRDFDTLSCMMLADAKLHQGTLVDIECGGTLVKFPGTLHHYSKVLKDAGEVLYQEPESQVCNAATDEDVPEDAGEMPDPDRPESIEVRKKKEYSKRPTGTSMEGKGDMLIGIVGLDVLLGKTASETIVNLRIYASLSAKLRCSTYPSAAPPSLPIDIPLFFAILCSGSWPLDLVLATPWVQGHFAAASIMIDEHIERDARVRQTILMRDIQKKQIATTKKRIYNPECQHEDIASTGLLLSCTCVICGVHIFHRFYCATDELPAASKQWQAWCGDCVVEKKSQIRVNEATRFGRTESKEITVMEMWKESKSRMNKLKAIGLIC